MANLPPLPDPNNLGVIDQFTVNYIHLFAPTKAALNTLSNKVDTVSNKVDALPTRVQFDTLPTRAHFNELSAKVDALPTRAHFNELSAKVDNLNPPTRAQFDQLLASLATLNTKVDKIDHLAYNTKARMLNKSRTVKDVALLSLRDKDGGSP